MIRLDAHSRGLGFAVATRAQLLAADLIVFDRTRLGWVIATRAIFGLAVPLLLAHAIDRPQLVWVGLGAYLLTIGDSTDDGDRGQPLRIIVGTVLGGLALTSGVLAGSSLGLAVVGMVMWGVLTGMMGVYGRAFGTMALPIAWAYVELGLPAPDHTMAHALSTGALFASGGLLALLLSLTMRPGGSFAPVRARTAACFRLIADYLGATQNTALSPPETQVRAAIADARRMAAHARQAGGAIDGARRILLLIEISDRVYSMIGAMREMDEPIPAQCATALRAIARLLAGRGKPAELAQLQADLARQAASTAGVLGRAITQELCHALSVATTEELPMLPIPPDTPARLSSALLAPLSSNLSLQSVITRHALRFAAVAGAAVVVFWFFPKPFGYWVPLTATVVLKPFVGLTFTRAIQRAVGTGIGILIGSALIPFLTTAPSQFAAVILLFFGMMTVLPFNYSLSILLLSAGLIPFEHLLTPGLHAAIGPDRLIATAIGAALALIGGYLLWPSFEKRTLPDLLSTCTRTMAAYADAVIGTAQGDKNAHDMQAERRRAGVALSNLQHGVRSAFTEIGGGGGAPFAFLQAASALQRISAALNALLQAAGTLDRPYPALKAFRADFVPSLADPWENDCPGPAIVLVAEVAMLSPALDRLTAALETLRKSRINTAQ
jgi:uncharacterized membrane protein YccC